MADKMGKAAKEMTEKKEIIGHLACFTAYTIFGINKTGTLPEHKTITLGSKYPCSAVNPPPGESSCQKVT